MRTDLIEGKGALRDAESAWRALEQRIDPPVFRRYGWARVWLEHVGSRGEPWIVLVGEPVSGLLGLVLERVGPARTLRLIGHGLSDYPGLLGVGDLQAMWRSIGERLRREARRFDLLDLCGLDAEEPERHALVAGMRRPSGGRLYERCPNIDTRSPWSDFLAAKSKKFRKNVRQVANRMRSAGEVVIGRENGSELLFDEIRSVERDSWKWEHGLSYTRDERRREFLRAVLDADDLPVERWTCRIDGELAGYAVAFLHQRTRIDYLSSYRCRLGGAGSFLLAEMVRSSCEEEIDTFDLGQGDEPYKLFWATGERAVWDWAVPGTRWLAWPTFLARRTRWQFARSDRLRRLRSQLLLRLQTARTRDAIR